MADATHKAGIVISGDASGAVDAAKKTEDAVKRLQERGERGVETARKHGEESARFVERLKEQAGELGKTGFELERYRASLHVLTDAQRKSIDASLSQIAAYERKEQSLRFVRNAAITAGAAIGAYVTATALGVKAAIDHAAALENLRQRTGVSVETLSVYGYAAKLAGVSQEELASGMKLLAKNLSEAQGGVGDAARLFALLGREIESAARNGASIEDMLPLLADKFASFADGPNKTALALALFGRAGEALIPFLNKGKSGVEALREEMERLGIVVRGDTARAADQFNTDLERLSTAMGAMRVQIASSIVPALADMASAMIEARLAGDGFFGMFAAGMHALTGGDLNRYRRELSDLAEEIFQLENQQARMQGVGGWAGARGRQRVASELSEKRARAGVVREMVDQLEGEEWNREFDRIYAEEERRALRQAPPLPATGTADAQQRDEFGRLRLQFSSSVAELQFEAASTEKVTEAQKKRLQLIQAVADGTLKLSGAQQEELYGLLELGEQLERDRAARELQRKALEEGEKALTRSADAQRQWLAGLEDQNIKLAEHNEEIGITAEQLGELRVRRAEEVLAIAEQNHALVNMRDSSAEELELARQRVAAARELVRLTRDGAARSVAAERAKQMESDARRTSETLERGITDALWRGFERGEGALDNFIEVAKNAFKVAIFEPVIRPIVQPIAQFGAAISQSLVNSIVGGAAPGYAGGMFGAGAAGSGIGSWFGAGAASAGAGSMLGGWWTGAASGSAASAALIESGTAGAAGAGLEAAALGSGWMSYAPYLVAGYQLLKGDAKGAALTAGLTYAGGALFGPLGAIGGAAIGGMLGGGGDDGDRGPKRLSNMAQPFGTPYFEPMRSSDDHNVAALNQAGELIAKREQEIIAQLNLNAEQLGRVNEALAASRREVNFSGQTIPEWLASGGADQFARERLAVVESVVGKDIQTAIAEAARTALAEAQRPLREQLELQAAGGSAADLARLRVRQASGALGVSGIESTMQWQSAFAAALRDGVSAEALQHWQALGQAIQEVNAAIEQETRERQALEQQMAQQMAQQIAEEKRLREEMEQRRRAQLGLRDVLLLQAGGGSELDMARLRLRQAADDVGPGAAGAATDLAAWRRAFASALSSGDLADEAIRRWEALGQAIEATSALVERETAERQALLDQADDMRSRAADLAGGLRRGLGIESLVDLQHRLAVAEFNAPADRLAASRAAYADIVGRARAGDVEAITVFSQLAQERLGIEREFFASGTGFQDAFREVNRDLAEILGRQTDKERELMEELTAVVDTSGRNTVDAIETQTRALVAEFKKLRDQLDKAA